MTFVMVVLFFFFFAGAATAENLAFFAVSDAATVDGVAHRIAMSGTGQFTASQVEATGIFTHFDNAAAVPKTILSAGTWQAKRLVSSNLIGAYGLQRAGILKMEVDLVQEVPSPAVIPATLDVICNIGAAGLATGEEEGFKLNIPGASFGEFKPIVPAFGLTLLSQPIEIITGVEPAAWGLIKTMFLK
jgi:hypothetical protein